MEIDEPTFQLYSLFVLESVYLYAGGDYQFMMAAIVTFAMTGFMR